MRWTVVAALMLAPVAQAGYSTPQVGDDPRAVWQCQVDGIMVFQRGACPPGATVKGWNVPDVQKPADAEGQRLSGEPLASRLRERMDRAAEIEANRLNWRVVRDEPGTERLAKEVAVAVTALSLHDPDSLQVASWGDFQTNGQGYRIDMRYRARNRLGALVLEGKRFYFDSEMRPLGTVDLE